MSRAPFIEKEAMVPGDQMQRFGDSQELQMAHYDTPLAGTGQIANAESPLFNSPTRLGDDDLCSLKEAGRFSDLKQFVIYGIAFQMYFTQLADPVGTEASAEELYDLACYYSRLHIKYQDADKQVLWGDQLPAGGGIQGYSQVGGSFHLTNGQPVSGAFYRLDEGLVITPQKTFRFIWKWLSNITNVTPGTVAQEDPRTRFNNAIRSQKLVRLVIHGVEVRDQTNG